MNKIYLGILLALAGCGGGTSNSPITTQQQPVTQPHKTPTASVLIIGDMWSNSWFPYVQHQEQGIATVSHAILANPTLDGGTVPSNDQDSATEAANIDAWLAGSHYTVVHFDAELDFDTCHGTQYLNSISAYTANLVYIAQKIQATGARAVYSTSPSDVCHPDAQAQEYNSAAIQALTPLGVTIDNLYQYGPVPIPAQVSVFQEMAASVVQSFGYIPY